MAEEKGYTIAQAYIQIMPSTSKFGDAVKGDMTSEGEKAGGHFSGGFKTGLKVIGAATAAAATLVSKVVVDSVKEFSEYEQLVGGVQKLFGEFDAQSVVENASEAFKTAGMSANDYMETVTSFSASLISSLEGDTQAAVEYADMAISDMSDNANVFGTDMESIQNAYQGFAKQNYTMLDNLKLGYGGTKTEMERLVTDAEGLNSAFKATRDENGNLTLSFADVVEAIHIVQDNMNITGTTAREASTTIQGSVSSMKAAWSNLLVGLSDDSQDFGQLVNNLVETIVGVEDASGERVGGVINNIMPRVTQALEGLGTLIKTMIPELVGYIPEILGAVLPGLLESAGALVDSFLGTLPDIITVVAEALPGLLTSLGDSIISGFNSLTEELPTLAESLSGVLSAILTYVSENADDLISSFADFLSVLISSGITILSENTDELITAFMAVVEAVIKAAIEHPELIAAIIGMKAIKSIGSLVIGTIGTGISNGKTTLINKIKDIFSSSDFTDSVNTAGDTLGKEMAASTGGGFASGLETAFTLIGGSVILVEGAKTIWTAYKGYLDEQRHSEPSWIAEQELVENTMQSTNLLADSYNLLAERLGGIQTKQEIWTGQVDDTDTSIDALIGVLEGYEEHGNAVTDILGDWGGELTISNGAWLELAKYLGYSGLEAEGVATNLREMYGPLFDAYEAEKAAAEATQEFAQEETNLATETETSTSVIDDIYAAVFSESIPTALQTSIQNAENAGIQIPEALVTGLENGQIAEQSAIDRMNALVNFQTAVESAGIGGTSVSQSFVDSWLAGEYDWTTANDYLNKLIDFTDAINAASDSGYELTTEFVNGLLDDYGLSGVISAAEVIGTDFSDSLEGTADQAGDAAEVIYSEVVDTIDPLSEEMEGQGSDAGSGLNTGFGDWNSTVSDTVDDMYALFELAFSTTLAPQMGLWGYNAGDRFDANLKLEKDYIAQTAQSIADAVEAPMSSLEWKMQGKGYMAGSSLISGLNSATQYVYDNMVTVGNNAMIGFNNGMVAMEGLVYDTARAIANNAVNVINSSLQIGSPSRVLMQTGEFVGEGLAIGLMHSSEDVMTSAADMASGVVDTAQGMFRNIDAIAMGAVSTDNNDIAQAISAAGTDYSKSIQAFSRSGQTNMEGYMMQILTLLDALSHMQMVTDTGVLAGEMAPAMDAEFNAMRLRENRG